MTKNECRMTNEVRRIRDFVEVRLADCMEVMACEIDADYFAAACERIERETAQMGLFAEPMVKPEPEGMLL